MPDLPKPLPTERLSDSVPAWFTNFISLPSVEEIYELVAAANFLDVPGLVELGCAKIGSLMKNKSIVELR